MTHLAPSVASEEASEHRAPTPFRPTMEVQPNHRQKEADMEIKVENGTIVLTCKDDAQEVAQAFAELAKHHARLLNHTVSDTGEPLFGSDGRLGVTINAGTVRLAIGMNFGSLVYFLNEFTTCQLIQALSLRTCELMESKAAAAEVAQEGISLQ